jgi:hypothetical protein
MDSHRDGQSFFPYEIDAPFRLPLRLFGVRSDRDGVTVTSEDELVATLGRLRVVTPISNVEDAQITEGYAWYKVVGPRLSLADQGLTFGTSSTRGLCIHFREPVGPVIGRRPHPALTVTVADCAGLRDAIT